MILNNYRYITIEGPIGAGKTSLAKQLANHLGGSLLLEDPEENPFLEKSYLPLYLQPKSHGTIVN